MMVRWIAVAGLVVMLGGCVSPRPPSGSEGRAVNFRPGTPQYDADATVVREDDGTLALDVRWGIYPASLIWTSPRGEIYAIVEAHVAVRDVTTGLVAASHVERDTLRVARPEEARSYTYVPQHVRLPLDRGRFEVDIRVVDGITANERSRTVPVVIPAGEEPVQAGRIALYAAQTRQPILSLHVAPSDGRVIAESQVLGDRASDVVARLTWIQSDTTVADPPYFLNRTRGSVRVRGVRTETTERLSEQHWTAVEPFQPVRFEFDLDRGGLYRVEFEVDGEVTQRDLVVRPESFPSIDRIDTMAEALAYIASDREVREILAADDEREMRRRFDAFWMERGGDERSARQLLALYYSRVAEANRLFTGVKEGWKSDRGMVFIIRGSPLFVERTLDREVWYYSYSEVNPAEIYAFERMPMFEFAGQFEQFVLQRGPMYEYEWRRYIERWRAGRAP